jgi:chaperonin GroES
MHSIQEVTPLYDNVVLRRERTADREGSIFIPESAVDGRKLHRSGGDYIFTGIVVSVGRGDKRRDGSRIPLEIKPGDRVLYENRRDAEVKKHVFPSLELNGEHYVFALAEQHVLAILE